MPPLIDAISGHVVLGTGPRYFVKIIIFFKTTFLKEEGGGRGRGELRGKIWR